MISTMLLSDTHTTTASHMGGGSIWMVLSMLAFSAFLLLFAWSLLRPNKQPATGPADIATELYAQGKISAEDFERIVRDTRSRTPRDPT